MTASRRLLSVLLWAGLAGAASAQQIKPLPPPANEISAADRTELDAGVAALGKEIQSLANDLKAKPALLALLPDVQIYLNAVRYPLVYQEQLDVPGAKRALAEGNVRAAQLRAGETPWLAGGPRGYLSKIDGSVQPFVLMVPPSYKPGNAKKYRLDFVEHGRNEGLTELKMIQTRRDNAVGGSMEKFVVLLYGRYCNANKFAGEIDLLEVLDLMKKQYPIDENRILNIGFSMGGASCWQFATHYTDLFAAASPGAGFAETREFLHMNNGQIASTPWYEKKLWHLYDCTEYAANLANIPTVAYAGEIDPQKQSSDIMIKFAEADGVKIDRVIGPNTGHAYERTAKAELDKKLDAILTKGREPVPASIRLTTWMLRYNHMYWAAIDAMDHEWDRARVDAQLAPDSIIAKTQNVTALTFSFADFQNPFPRGDATIDLDGTKLQVSRADGMQAWSAHFVKTAAGWKEGSLDATELRKRSGLQGPIDDAFMDRFVIVKPSGKALNEKPGAWAVAECQHAIAQWQKQFRGEARVKTAEEITDADLAFGNLVLFGDPSSNPLIARIADKLPIKWTAKEITIGAESYPADHHAAVLIYPNPLNPAKYIVLNSGFTFRELDYTNNARQVPKLPDYAVVDVDSPVTSRAPGKIVSAGFFGEKWELLANHGNDGR